MNLRGRTPDKTIRLAHSYLLFPCAFLIGTANPAWGDEGSVSKPGAAEAASRASGVPGHGTLGREDRPPSVATGLRYSGTPTPGARITIGVDGPVDPNTTFHWVQVEGPSVAVDDDTKSRIQLTIPPGAQQIGFLVALKDANGQRTARVTIPIQPSANVDPSAPRADAGDDQIGLVGRRITLNGSRSTPRGEVALRWFALAGPKVENAIQESSYFSFTPTVPGVYRFGLVAASTNASGEIGIADLDEVLVTVGETASAFGGGAAGAISGGFSTTALDQMLQGPGSISARATLDQAAGVFEAIAARASLYTSFADLSSEMMRRLDAIIPADQQWRQFWSQGVFAPLTQHIVSEMLSVSLDLRVPQAQYQGLSALQQDKLQKLFSSYAREFRSRTQAR
jgi:hypothetical protein